MSKYCLNLGIYSMLIPYLKYYNIHDKIIATFN